MSARALLLAPLLACHGPEPATAPDASPAPPIEPPAGPAPLAADELPALDPARRCGEPGRDPTDLPEALRAGLGPLATGVLHPGDRLSHGTVTLEYDPDRIVTPTDIATVRSPVVSMICGRDEVDGGGAYGTYNELHFGHEFHLTIGPYRLDARSSADGKDVPYTLSRRACPERTRTAATTDPRSLWLSTEAIRVHTHAIADATLHVFVDGRGDAPRLDISTLAYRQNLEPRPGEPRSFKLGRTRVTIDRVVPGPHTRFEHGTWSADGDARLHARVHIDPLAPDPLPAPVPATTPCGDASPVRTTLPADLTALPRAQGDVVAPLGTPRQLGDLRFTLREHTLPAPNPRRQPETYQTLDMLRGDQLLHSLSLRWGAPALHRLDRQLLRVDPSSPPPQARVRRIPLACPATHDLPSSPDPVYVWLSTVGHHHVRVGTADIPPLALTMFEDLQYPSFGASSPNASFSSPRIPDHVGLAYTLDGYEVEIVDVIPGGDTRPATNGWQSSALAPVFHVQVRVTPAAAP